MKIILVSVAPPYRGGISTHSAILAKHLSTYGHNLKVLNFSRQYPEFLFPGKTQYFTNNEFSNFKSNRCIDSIGPWSWKLSVQKIINFAPDLLIFRFWNPFFGFSMGSIAKAVKHLKPEIKQIALCDNIIPHESSMIDKWLTMKIFNQVDAFLVQSNKVKDELKKLMPNALVEKRFHPVYENYGTVIDKKLSREKIGLDKKYIILFFGIIRDYKGLDILIHACSLLKKDFRNFHVLIVGESYSNKDKYESLIQELGVNDVIKWEDRFITDSEIPLYFSAADVMALPYKSASQSGIIQTAYNFNLPVVATKVGGIPEYIDEGVSGYTIEANNPSELAFCIQKGLDNGAFKRMKKDILSIKSKFSWSNFIDGIHTLYNQL